MNTTDVDSFLRDGCGRCDHYQTPQCTVHLWTDALVALRELLQDSELVEAMKWGSPCYAFKGKNVAMIVSRREWCGLSLFRGAELTDESHLLEKPGPNTRVARVIKFTTVDEVLERRSQIVELVQQAIELVRQGKEAPQARELESMPLELDQKLSAEPELAAAFAALTPGRQRSHILHISGAKKPETRQRRVEKCIPKILAGRGFNER
ncbi:hypothetical protein DL240_02785 [Lujinxingia litoralis]|uniref:YdhG-like domain-containing protein n=1 Tax=Lujinxingia litoralis TaxID=2211119 RepID=A0A328CE69_9DELT|nr:YdeI/OmpD-associated family protein [Lujinxingia litoralis]RAL25153.1 hypothetical protein DL240_02785 [Lujinxingia litoralis]